MNRLYLCLILFLSSYGLRYFVESTTQNGRFQIEIPSVYHQTTNESFYFEEDTALWSLFHTDLSEHIQSIRNKTESERQDAKSRLFLHSSKQGLYTIDSSQFFLTNKKVSSITEKTESSTWTVGNAFNILMVLIGVFLLIGYYVVKKEKAHEK